MYAVGLDDSSEFFAADRLALACAGAVFLVTGKDGARRVHARFHRAESVSSVRVAVTNVHLTG